MRDYNPHNYMAFKCLSKSPLITISTFETFGMGLLKLAERVPGLFETTKGLHLLSLTWNVERPKILADLVKTIRSAEKAHPGHLFVVLAYSSYASHLLSQERVANIVANSSIFVDEAVWHANRSPSAIVRNDACYVARFHRFKRHELAQKVNRLSLIFGGADMEREPDIRKALPQAAFLNKPTPDSPYSYLGAADILKVLHESSVALCLSAEEGFSRTSIEALMAGLPVVSTRSIGGRDRYYDARYVEIVDDTPEAVAAGIERFKAAPINPQAIRAHVGTLLNFDRMNMVTTVNALLRDLFSDMAPVLSFDDFRDSIHDFQTLDDYVIALNTAQD